MKKFFKSQYTAGFIVGIAVSLFTSILLFYLIPKLPPSEIALKYTLKVLKFLLSYGLVIFAIISLYRKKELFKNYRKLFILLNLLISFLFAAHFSVDVSSRVGWYNRNNISKLLDKLKSDNEALLDNDDFLNERIMILESKIDSLTNK